MKLRWCLCITVVLALHGAGLAADHTGRVVAVLDGDTVHVLTESKQLIRVRLAGIDAPEKQQAYGGVAMRTLFALTHDRQVEVVGHKVDRYGRLVAKVLVARSDVSLQMLERGLAWHYKQYEQEQEPQDRWLYAQAELTAREQRIGLWGDKAPMPPWEFRSARRNRPSGESAAPVRQAPAPAWARGQLGSPARAWFRTRASGGVHGAGGPRGISQTAPTSSWPKLWCDSLAIRV